MSKTSQKNRGQRGASAVVPSWLDNDDPYARHYDSTVAKRLCMNGDGHDCYSYQTELPNGKVITVETIWCFECWVDCQENCQLVEKPC